MELTDDGTQPLAKKARIEYPAFVPAAQAEVQADYRPEAAKQDLEAHCRGIDGDGSSQTTKSTAELMMEKMGFKTGSGLGIHGQGITEAIKESDQTGRQGLGFRGAKGLEYRVITDQALEVIVVEQPPDWMPISHADVPTAEDYEDSIGTGEWSLKIEEQNEYVDKELFAELIRYKTLLDDVGATEFRPARDRANPFEAIKGEFFQNRAALKMAELDAVFGFMFTQPKGLNPEKELLWFADLCAGPGGFTEAIMWRKGWKAKGFGFTLRGGLDFKLHRFNQSSPYDSFFPYYGVDDSGDIYNTSSMRELREIVREETGGKMLHFVTADGGCDFVGEENAQEVLDKQLMLCQVALAMSLLREGGRMAVKCFDLNTQFSADLVYIVYRHFDRSCIYKPHTSRPANSERFLVAEGFRSINPAVVEHLFAANDVINSFKSVAGNAINQQMVKRTGDVIRLLRRGTVDADEPFAEFLLHSNKWFVTNQTKALAKVNNFIRDKSLPSEDQADIRLKCLRHWQVPDNMVQPERALYAPDYYNAFIKGDSPPNLGWVPKPMPAEGYITMTREKDPPRMTATQDWACVHLTCRPDSLGFFMSNRGRNCFVWLERPQRWDLIDNLKLPPSTFLFGEITRGQQSERSCDVLRVVDVMLLGGVDVRRKPYADRMLAAALFGKAISRHPKVAPPPEKYRSKGRYMTVEIARYFSLAALGDALVGVRSGVTFDGSSSLVRYQVRGLLFFPVKTKTVPKDFAKKVDDRGVKYYEHQKTKKVLRLHELPAVPLSFRSCAAERVVCEPRDAPGRVSLDMLTAWAENHHSI